MFILLRAKKGIPKTTFILVSANKKVPSKNRILPVLSWIKNPAITISYVFKAEPLIFCTSISVGQIERSNLAANTEVMVLILLPELIKALI